MLHNELISVLERNKLLRSPFEVSEFEKALAALARIPDHEALTADYEALTSLFLVFTDKCKHPEVMWGLLHFIESLGMEKQLAALVRVIPSVVFNAPEWMELVHCRLLNNENYRMYYRELVSIQPATTRDAIERLLRKIEASDPDFAPHVDYVLSSRQRGQK